MDEKRTYMMSLRVPPSTRALLEREKQRLQVVNPGVVVSLTDALLSLLTHADRVLNEQRGAA